jgi:uncharacterized damage-inducible protein DinB
MIESLAREFAREAETTRRHLERLPGDRLGWRPHEKSFTAGGLASHIVECIRFTDSICSRDELDIDPKTYVPYEAASVSDLLSAFDEAVAAGNRALAASTDASMGRPWRFKVGGKLRWEKSRADVLRDFTLSHLIHHRGQFTVYLRLLDVPVPGSYGPSADDAAPARPTPQ